MLWRAKVFRVDITLGKPTHRLLIPKSASFDNANARYTPTASAYAVAPAPPSRKSGRRHWADRRWRHPARRAPSLPPPSRRKVVRATSWREVKRSAHVKSSRILDHAELSARVSRFIGWSGFHIGSVMRDNLLMLRRQWVPYIPGPRSPFGHDRPSALLPCARPCFQP